MVQLKINNNFVRYILKYYFSEGFSNIFWLLAQTTNNLVIKPNKCKMLFSKKF